VPRFSVTLDPALLQAALQAAGGRLRRRQVIELALREFVRRHNQEALRELAGTDVVDMTPDELQGWRRAGLEAS